MTGKPFLDVRGSHGSRAKSPNAFGQKTAFIDTHRRYPGRVGAMNRIRVARVYDDVSPDEGQRVLVDRVWPRGVRKDDPRVGIWCKDVAPSKELASGITTSPNGSTNSLRATRRNCATAPRWRSCAS